MQLVNPIVGAWKRQATEDPDGFWANAAQQLPWFRPWERVLEWTPPTFKWFVGAETNLGYNCLDVQVRRGWGGHAALITENERGERRVYTYAQLLRAVEQASAALRGLGIGSGDRVAIYMPTCAEAVIAMLACARIGAIHLVVFAGFGAGALGDRIEMAEAKAVLTADVTWRKGKEVRLKEIVDAALEGSRGTARKVVVL